MREYFDAPPDFEIDLTVEMSEMMTGMMAEIEKDMMDGMMEERDDAIIEKGMSMQDMTREDGMNMHGMPKEGIEWEDEMPKMNVMATDKNTKWILKDKKTGKKNMDLGYQVRVGDIKKIRFFNDPESPHPMQHPIHLHGQRFLVLSVNGEENTNLVWKDTVLVQKGATVDILVDFTNPGDWMFHCHISEHLTAGMMGVFRVLP